MWRRVEADGPGRAPPTGGRAAAVTYIQCFGYATQNQFHVFPITGAWHVPAMSKIREFIAYGVAIIASIVAILAVTIGKGSNASLVAAWVQAVGSIAAIVLVTMPVFLQQSLAVRRAKDVTLAAVDTAWSVMQAVADRYANPEKPMSEWWVPQFDILNQTLAASPIHEVGSAEATRAFIHFRELFQRSEGFAEPEDGSPLMGFVGFIMTNADTEVAALRKLLK